MPPSGKTALFGRFAGERGHVVLHRRLVGLEQGGEFRFVGPAGKRLHQRPLGRAQGGLGIGERAQFGTHGDVPEIGLQPGQRLLVAGPAQAMHGLAQAEIDDRIIEEIFRGIRDRVEGAGRELQAVGRAFDAPFGFVEKIGRARRNVLGIENWAFGQGGVVAVGGHHVAALFRHGPGEGVEKDAFGQGHAQGRRDTLIACGIGHHEPDRDPRTGQGVAGGFDPGAQTLPVRQGGDRDGVDGQAFPVGTVIVFRAEFERIAGRAVVIPDGEHQFQFAGRSGFGYGEETHGRRAVRDGRERPGAPRAGCRQTRRRVGRQRGTDFPDAVADCTDLAVFRAVVAAQGQTGLPPAAGHAGHEGRACRRLGAGFVLGEKYRRAPV